MESGKLTERKSNETPMPLRVLFLAIGIPMLLLCYATGIQLSRASTQREVLDFTILLILTIWTIVFVLPARFHPICYESFTLLKLSIAVGWILWLFGGTWKKWGILALVVGTPLLFILSLRKGLLRSKSSEGLDGGDLGDSGFGGGDGGDGGGD